MKKINNKEYYEERPLYGVNNVIVDDCYFSSEKDGESAFKEARDVVVINSRFSMRYPFWHTSNFKITDSSIDELTRAAIWYAKNGSISNTVIKGVKCLRESRNINFIDCNIVSAEFGWKNDTIEIDNCDIEGEYQFFDSKNIKINNLRMQGKYSFQYVDNMEMIDSVLDTKDAFWHSKNVVVRNTRIKGEYLGWYSKNLTLINCEIIGTQPLCYCENLLLIDCKMVDADLSFEYSEVNGNVIGKIDSIKNGKSGKIIVDEVFSIILGESIMASELVIETLNKKS